MPLFKKILVPVDGSCTSDKALGQALALARESQARVRLLHALDELAYVSAYEFSGELMTQARANAEKMLQKAAGSARAQNVEVDTHLVDNPGQRLGETVADEAVNWGADLIVLGTHGRRGVGRVLLGSGAEQVIRLAPVPVLVVRSD